MHSHHMGSVPNLSNVNNKRPKVSRFNTLRCKNLTCFYAAEVSEVASLLEQINTELQIVDRGLRCSCS